jgi:hypothetical protein
MGIDARNCNTAALNELKVYHVQKILTAGVFYLQNEYAEAL